MRKYAAVKDTCTLRLEERIAWLEKHIVEQDKAMLQMADDLSRLKKQIIELRERQHSQTGGSPQEDDISERPPHY